MTSRERWAVRLATVGGAGRVPWGPGTAGALVGTAVAALTETTPAGQSLLLAAALLAGVWAIPRAQRVLGAADPPAVVLDEFAGALVTFLGVPLTPLGLLAGFAAFRLLDIVKPPPLRWLERLPGPWGVLADDLAAGLAAHLVAWGAPLLR